MPGLNPAARKFVEEYSDEYNARQRAAEIACARIQEILKSTGAFVHIVSGRAKKPESLRGKLRRKSYKNPRKQLTDLIGVRVITYYSDDVEPVVDRLRREFEIDSKNSVDKRGELDLHAFGYRSVHLIAKLRGNQVRSLDHLPLRENWFEIQVRSVLEHAWAEIEHEVVYKSGISFPDSVQRQFARLAGVVELLDREFLNLRSEKENLIKHYTEVYGQGQDQRMAFDVARLSGFLRAKRPEGQASFGLGLEASCLEALKAAGLGTASSLRATLGSSRFRYVLNTFASLQGIAPANASHLATVVLAVLVKKPKILRDHFPEIVTDPAIAQIVDRRVGN